MWPLLLRELRLEARRPFNRNLRLGAAVLFFILLAGSLNEVSGVDAICRRLFPILHTLLVVLPWCVAPTLTAEVIARERRTGMLEILQLTRVSLGAIVQGITAVVTARTLTVLMAAFPVITFTVLFGGVGADELFLSVLLQAVSMSLALSVAILAGSLGRTWPVAMAWAALFGALLGGGVACGLYFIFQQDIGGPYAAGMWPAPGSIRAWMEGVVRFIGDRDSVWSLTLGTLPPAQWIHWRHLLWVALGGAAVISLPLRFLAVWLLRRSLRARAQSHGTGSRTWSARLWPGRVNPATRRAWLRGNPVRWLMRYPAESRWVRVVAGVAALGVEVVLALVPMPFDVWFGIQIGVLLLLSAGLALAAAGSFRTERDNGALELLMVTPMRPRDLSRGRIGGLWWILGPAFGVWAAGVWLTVPMLRNRDDHVALFGWGLALLAAIPAVGLEAAFQFRGYWRSACATLGLTLGISGVVFWLGEADEAVFWVSGLNFIILAVVAGLSAPGFEQRFTRRRNGEKPGSFHAGPPQAEFPRSPYESVLGQRMGRPGTAPREGSGRR